MVEVFVICYAGFDEYDLWSDAICGEYGAFLTEKEAQEYMEKLPDYKPYDYDPSADCYTGYYIYRMHVQNIEKL